jgi:hypothetical protein
MRLSQRGKNVRLIAMAEAVFEYGVYYFILNSRKCA